MRVDEFYQMRRDDWQALSLLLDRSEKRIAQLSPQDVDDLGRLYQAATADLALAQRDFPGHRATVYLNQLVARAHAVVYRGEPMAGRRLWHFVTAGFPRTFRETLPFTLVATLLFVVPALAAGLIVGWQPGAAEWLLPTSAQDLLPSIERQELWTDIPIYERPFASSFIMRNNIQVAFLAFSSGLLCGLPTVWILVSNGLTMGGLSGLTSHYGIGFDLWTFVIGHGVIELSTIFIAGGSGLMLGWAVIHPGLMSRRDALTTAARKTARLILGYVPLLIVAGTIEGFLSPAEGVPWALKWATGLGSGILLYAYLFLAGRDRPLRYRSVRPFSSR